MYIVKIGNRSNGCSHRIYAQTNRGDKHYMSRKSANETFQGVAMVFDLDSSPVGVASVFLKCFMTCRDPQMIKNR